MKYLIILSLIFAISCKPEQEATQYNITDEIITDPPPKDLGDDDDGKVGHAPVAHNQEISMYYNTAKTFQFAQATDDDEDNEGFIYEIVEGVSHGTLTDCLLSGPLYSVLDCTYTPEANYVGIDEIKYKVTDSTGLVSLNYGVVTINVFANNGDCENQKRLSIFLDQNKNDAIDEGEKLGEVSAYTGNISTEQNYGYYSASAHPVNGPTPSGYQGNVFFYNGSDGLSLNFFFNVDNGGSSDNQVQWDLFTTGNGQQDGVLVADDPNGNELYEGAMLGEWQTYIGDWHYWKNTDGGAIGPFVGEDFIIKVKMIGKGDVQDIKFYSVFTDENGTINDDIEIITSNMGNDAPDTFFVKYADVQICGE